MNDIDPQLLEEMKHQKDLAQRRAAWEQEHARQKEQERLQHARAELAREKKHRLDSWMAGGGDPADFEKAWPSIQTAIMEERYRSRREQAEDIAAG